MKNDQMRISLIGPVFPFRGGIAHHTTSLAHAIVQTGSPLCLISYKRLYPKWLYPGKSDRDPSKSVYQTPVPAHYLLDLFNPASWSMTAEKIIQKESQLAIIQWWTTVWAIPFVTLCKKLKEKNIPIVFLIHNVLPHEKHPWDVVLARLGLKQADGFITHTEIEAKRLAKLINHVNNKTLIHPLPTYSFLSNQKVEKQKARERLGLPLGKSILLFFGIVRPYKGLSILLEAMSILNKEGIEPLLVIAGEFWEREEKYRKQISKLSLIGQVRIENRYIPDEEVPLLFSSADLFIAPYIRGTQSGAVSMALGFGLPVIVTESIWSENLESLASVIKCIPPSNALALSEAIKEIISQHPIYSINNMNKTWIDFVEAIKKWA